jgi:catechol 2,3-dioxygenase-like lactoylglutathione lyase family enzyme
MEMSGILIYVKDIDRSIAFYEGVLAMKVTSRPAEDFAILDAGSVSLYLHRDPRDPSPPLKEVLDQPYRGVGVIIHVRPSDIGKAHEKLLLHDVEIFLGPIDQPFGERQIYLYDPDGYNVVLSAAIE